MMRASRAAMARRTPVLRTPAPEVNITSVPKPTHKRSGFKYSGSEKAADVGARNEAAFIDYAVASPRGMTQKYAAPHALNLLTVLPAFLAAAFYSASVWGIAVWNIYVSRHFTPIAIDRPKA